MGEAGEREAGVVTVMSQRGLFMREQRSDRPARPPVRLLRVVRKRALPVGSVWLGRRWRDWFPGSGGMGTRRHLVEQDDRRKLPTTCGRGVAAMLR